MLKQFEKGMGENVCTYPLTYKQIKNLKPCRIVSPRNGYHFGVKIPDSFNVLEAAKEIEKIKKEVDLDIYPQWFMDKYYPYEGECPKDLTGPLRLEGLSKHNPKALADVVHMDYPTDLGKAMVTWLLKKGYNVKNKDHRYVNFLQSIPYMEEKLTNSIKLELEKSFRVKYYYGIARPEEILGYNVTSYPEGCPNHPATGQGHFSAAIGNVYAILQEFELLPKQVVKELLDTAYLWGQFRCLSRVHYGIDLHVSLAISRLKKYMRKELLEQYKRK